MAIARVMLRNRIKKMGLDVRMVSTVHDSIVLDSPSKHTQTAVNLFHQVFDDLPANIHKLFGVDWNVPLAGEVSVGLNEKDMKEIERNA